MTPHTTLAARARDLLPRGEGLDDQAFATRQGLLRVILIAHLPALAVFGVVRGYPVLHVLAEVAPVAGAVLAERLARRQGARAMWVTAGLAWCSTVLVHLAGGQIEAHFHYFIVVGLIALYQRWAPFAWAIGFTVLSHGVGTSIAPGSMFNHPSAVERPWLWAGVHGVSVLAAATAQVIFWSAAEDEHDKVRGLSRRVAEAARITDRQRARFEALVANAFDGVAITDPDGVVTWASPVLVDLMRVTVGDQLCRSVHPDDRGQLERTIATAGPDGAEGLLLRGTNGRWLELSVVDLVADEAVGGVVVNVRDVTDRKRAEAELEWQATHDGLTGLPNRARLTMLLEQHIAAHRDGVLALLFIDVDDFKAVNDRHGHAAGDLVLCRLAERLQAAVRADDVVGRLGGDEFVVLCTSATDVRHVTAVAARLAEQADIEVEVDGASLTVTTSIGVAFHEPGIDADELLLRADTAMYGAKMGGKDRYELFDAAVHVPAERTDPYDELAVALAAGQIVAHYQPIVSIADGTTTGLEALVRWDHPERGLIPPAEFIPVAEQTGLITEVGAAVLRQACRDLVAHDPDGRTYVSVNVSGLQLQRASFAATVRRALADSGLSPRRLVLEITETVVIGNDPVVRTNVEALAADGVRWALDDFGTGYSALVNLKRYAFDVVKVDREFVAGLGAHAGDAAIVAAVVGMAHALGLEVVAEGIESAVQMDALRAMGSDHGQGFAIGRPVPLASLPPVATAIPDELALG